MDCLLPWITVFAAFSTFQPEAPRKVPFQGVVIGKEVAVKQKSFEDAVNISIKMINGGKEPPAATKEIGARMFLYYNERGLVGNNNVLGWLLGREPTSYESWLKLKVEEINKQKA